MTSLGLPGESISLSVVIPVYNEAALLDQMVVALVEDLNQTDLSYEIILSENGSIDGSSEIADALAAKFPAVTAIHAPIADYGKALKRGMMAARGAGIANFSIDFIDMQFLLAGLKMLDRYDVVLGSKLTQPGTDRRPWVRRIGGGIFHKLIRVLFRLPILDTHGIKVFRRESIANLITVCQSGGALFDTELILYAYRAGLRLREYPVSVKEIRPSRRSLVAQAGRSLVGLLKLRISLLLNKTKYA